jgi:hypothetical protein
MEPTDMNTLGYAETSGNYEVSITMTTVKVLSPEVIVRRQDWTGTVYIKPGFGRQGGYGRRTRTSYQVWVNGSMHAVRIATKSTAVRRAELEVLRRAAKGVKS